MSSDVIDAESLDCMAIIAGDCPNDVVGAVDGVPVCQHHKEKSDVYDYPRLPDQEVVQLAD